MISVKILNWMLRSAILAWLCLFAINAWGSNDSNKHSLEDVLKMDLVIHFIDVGVGDAILIDGGDSRFGYDVLKYVKPLIDLLL